MASEEALGIPAAVRGALVVLSRAPVWWSGGWRPQAGLRILRERWPLSAHGVLGWAEALVVPDGDVSAVVGEYPETPGQSRRLEILTIAGLGVVLALLAVLTGHIARVGFVLVMAMMALGGLWWHARHPSVTVITARGVSTGRPGRRLDDFTWAEILAVHPRGQGEAASMARLRRGGMLVLPGMPDQVAVDLAALLDGSTPPQHHTS